jgi:protein phosphatase
MYNNIIYLSLPEECRLICISDIHGSIDLFKALLEKCKICDDDYLILLGDYIEKGNDSYGTLEYVKTLVKNRRNTYMITGNVDYAPHKILNEFEEDKAADYLFKRSKSIIHQWAQLSMLPEISRENIRELRKILFARYKNDIDFISSLPFAITTSDFIFVHVGVDSDTLNGINRKTFFNATGLLLDGKSPDGRWVVFGHFPTFNSPLSRSSNNPTVFEERKVVGIDGGNVLIEHGQLNTLIINKSGHKIDFSYEFTNYFNTRTILKTYEAENDNLSIFKCVQPPYEIIGEEEYFYICFAPDAGITGRVKKEQFKRDKNGCYFAPYNNISSFLSVEKGEEVYIINDDCEGYTLVKNMRGIIGWIRKDCTSIDSTSPASSNAEKCLAIACREIMTSKGPIV